MIILLVLVDLKLIILQVVLLISILVNTRTCSGKVHVSSVNVVFAYRDVWNHIGLLNS